MRRRGCWVGGCAVVLGLVLLYPLVLLAQIIVPLALGFLFPWEPPVAEDAPQEAVLRVLAPEDEKYRVEWGSGLSQVIDEGEQVDPELGYRDYPVRDEAVNRSGSFDIEVYAGDRAEDKKASDGYPVGKRDVPLGIVLFVSGEYAFCEGGSRSLDVDFRTGSPEFGPAMMRMLCGSHRYAPL